MLSGQLSSMVWMMLTFVHIWGWLPYESLEMLGIWWLCGGWECFMVGEGEHIRYVQEPLWLKA